MSQQLTVAEHRRRWRMSTAAVLIIGVAGIAAIALARYDKVDLSLWGHYIALAMAVFSALAGLAFTFTRAAIESRGD